MLVFWWLIFITISSAKGSRTEASELPDVVFSEANCRILINEINTYAPNGQFIELSKYCEKPQKAARPMDMKLFRILFINHKGFIIGICKLHGMMTKTKEEKYWFYTVGEKNSDTINMDKKECQLPSYNPNDPHIREFPKGINYPMGMALVYNERVKTLDKLDLPRNGDNYQKLLIDDKLKNLIVQSLIDFYIYGAGTEFVYCKYFSTFFDGFESSPNPILRDWQDDDLSDISLSRCGIKTSDSLTLPFQRQLWAYTSSTPGLENSCQSGIKYYVEDGETARKRSRPNYDDDNCRSILEDSDTGYVSSPDNFQSGLMEAFNVSTAFRQLEANTEDTASQLDSHTYSNPNDEPAGNDELVCDNEADQLGNVIENEPDTESGDENFEVVDAPILNPLPAREVQAFIDSPIDFAAFDESLMPGKPYLGWDDCDGFNNDEITKINTVPGNPYDINFILKDNVCTWFELLDTHLMRCKLCNKLLSQGIIFDRPHSNKVTKIMTTGIGSLTDKRKKNQNKRYIEKHLDNPLHKISLQFFGKVDNGLPSLKAIFEMQHEDGPYKDFYNQTKNIIATVYQATRMGLPFFRFDSLVDLLKFFGVSVGHLYANRLGMRDILKSISHTMHNQLVEYLQKEQPPISIIIDEMTDVSTKSVVAICFQTLSFDKEVKVILYRIIELHGDTTGASIFAKFAEALTQDGLEIYFKANLVGMASDGGSNFRFTFRKKLQEYVNNEIITVHCNCHVLERINYHAYKDCEFFDDVDSKTNRIFKMFNSKSSKRKAVLEFMILKMNDSPFEVKRIQTIRWIASKLRALKNIILHWKTILKAIRSIMYDVTMPIKARTEASEIEDYLLDPLFLAKIAFNADIATKLSDVSVEFQKRGYTPILVKDKRIQLQEKMQNIDITDGEYVSMLFSRMSFNHPGTSAEEVTIESLESEPLLLEGIALNVAKPLNSTTLAEEFLKYTNRLDDKISDYYPGTIEENFWIFDPLKMDDMHESKNFSCEVLEELNTKLKWGYIDGDICGQWTTLVSNLVKDENFNIKKIGNPEKFWSFYLTSDQGLGMTDTMRDIIGKIITQPATSAEVERIFSLYSATKTLRRYRLDVSTVEDIIKVKFNSHDKINEFPADDFVRDFLKSHSRADDTSRKVRWVSNIDWENQVNLNNEGVLNLLDDDIF